MTATPTRNTTTRPTAPTTTPASLAAALKAFGNLVWEEVSRHPGGETNEIDREEWRIACRRLLPPVTARPESLVGGWADDGRPLWSASAWWVLFSIRNAEFRPTWQEVARLFGEHLGAGRVEVVSGADAAARQVYTAPPPPPVAALEGGCEEGAPPWLGLFARLLSKDAGGPFDQVLLVPLMRVSDAEAVRVIHEMADAQAAERERRAHAVGDRQRAQDARRIRDRERSRLGGVLSALRQEARAAAAGDRSAALHDAGSPAGTGDQPDAGQRPGPDTGLGGEG